MSSAAEEISNKADAQLANALVLLLPQILEPDSKTIENATEQFRELSKNAAFLPTLTQIMVSTETETGTRQLAAVLFRRRILKQWKGFPEEMQKLVRQASIEYISQADDVLYKSLAEIVAGIAEYELQNDGWPTLMEVMNSTVNATDYPSRLKGTELIKCVCIAACDPLVTHFENMVNLFGTLLSANDVTSGDLTKSQNVHKNVLDSMQALFPFMEDVHVAKARLILPRMVEVVDQLISWDETVGAESLALFSDLCEIEAQNLVNNECAKAMAEVCLRVAVNENMEEETRAIGLSQIQMIIKYKKKAFTKFNLVEPLCREMQKLIVNDPEPDDGIMSGGDGDRTVYTGALQVIDQLAMYLPAEKIIEFTAGSISDLLKDENSNAQRAGLLILSVIVEGCADLITANYMEDLVPAVCAHLSNSQSNVRSAAYFALGQFSEHLQPDIANYSSDVMPPLMKVILAGPSSPEFENRDVITKIYYALETFVESLGSKPNGIDPYLDDLMKTLVGSIANGESLSIYLLECIVGSIGAVATAADEKFASYLPKTVEVLQNYFPTQEALDLLEEQFAKAEAEGVDPPEDRTILWGRAIATLSSICRSVGAENYRPFAEKTLELAVTLSNHSEDPDVKGSAFSLFGALSSILKEEMQPHMKGIAQILFTALDEDVLDFTGDQTDDRMKAMANMLELSKDENIENEEGDLSMDELSNLNVETGPIEAKVTALETLGEIAEMCPLAFGEFMTVGYTQALKIAQFEGSLHDEILRAALTTTLIMSAQLFKSGELSNDDERKKAALTMCHEVWPMVLNSVKDTPERSVCMSLLYHLEKSIQIVGKVIFEDHLVLDNVMDTVYCILSDQAVCQDTDEENHGPTGEEDQAEHDQLLIEYACDILPSTCNAIGGDSFRDVWLKFSPVLKTRANNKKAGTTRAAALGAVADIMKSAGNSLACEFGPDLIETFVLCLYNKENNVRNNAIYGLGMIVSLGIETCSAQYEPVLTAFWKIIQNEKSDAVRDQVLGAVGRMIIAANSNQNINIPTESMVEGLLQALPVKADPMELAPVVLSLENYIPTLSDENVLKLVKNTAKISEDYGKTLEDETKIAITRLMKRVQADKDSILNELNDSEKAAIELACVA